MLLAATAPTWLASDVQAQRRTTEEEDLERLESPIVEVVEEPLFEPDELPYSVTDSVLRAVGDEDEIILSGLVARDPASGMTIEAERVVVRLDRDLRSRLRQRIDADGDLPRRGAAIPRTRRLIDGRTVRARIESFLSSFSPESAVEIPSDVNENIELVRSIYIEGSLRITLRGLEVLRADSLSWSILDDRILIENATLRYDSGQAARGASVTGSALLTIRTPALLRQNGRFLAAEARVTSDPRANPSFEVLSTEIEMFELGDAFRIRTRGNALLYHGDEVVPLPDQTWDTDEDSNIPLKSFSLGFGSQEGVVVSAAIGGSLTETLTSIVESLGGNPEGLRAEWRLGRGWIEKRGIPIEPQFRVRADGFQSNFRAFGLSDEGFDRGFVRTGPDGNRITEDQRSLVEWETLFDIGENTTLSLELFDASDAGVYAEFYRGAFIQNELPETSIHLRDSNRNYLSTITARANLADFNYTDDRTVATATRGPFVEELPRATLDFYAEQLGEVFDTPILLSTSTDLAVFRQDFARGTGIDDRDNTRLDQQFKLSTPFAVGPIRFRPYAASQFSFYDRGVTADDDFRTAYSAGLEIGTRISKTFSWFNSDGSTQRVRHVIVPTLRYDDVFSVSDSPFDFFQLDPIDALTESRRVRVGVLQRFQTRRIGEDGEGETNEFLWIDLAQVFFPDADRDNGGESLGFSEYEIILRDTPEWLGGLPIRFVFEGEYDWLNRELRTFNNYFEIRTGLPRWFVEYRKDRTDDGQLGYGVATSVRNRWRLLGRALYDFTRDEHINYTVELTRFDPNFSLSSGVRFDNIRDEVSLTFDVEFVLGGLVDDRRRRRLDGADGLARNHPAF
ncbi:MAG: hypothetical protein AAF196_11100 [Planctomycetota bacterium]